jgi:hypothetical protein
VIPSGRDVITPISVQVFPKECCNIRPHFPPPGRQTAVEVYSGFPPGDCPQGRYEIIVLSQYNASVLGWIREVTRLQAEDDGSVFSCEGEMGKKNRSHARVQEHKMPGRKIFAPYLQDANTQTLTSTPYGVHVYDGMNRILDPFEFMQEKVSCRANALILYSQTNMHSPEKQKGTEYTFSAFL